MRQAFVSARFSFIASLLLSVTALAGCSLFGHSDAIAAVTNAARLRHRATPTVHASFATTGGTMVIYSAQSKGECYFGNYLAEQEQGKWHARNGGNGGGPCPGQPGAVTQAYSRGSSSGSNPTFSWSLASGEIYDTSIVRLDIEWDDGVVTPAVVMNGIYYSFRDGVMAEVTSWQAYDSADQPVAETP